MESNLTPVTRPNIKFSQVAENQRTDPVTAAAVGAQWAGDTTLCSHLTAASGGDLILFNTIIVTAPLPCQSMCVP